MAKTKSWIHDFEKLDELGEGGNAKVYRVICKENNNEYALKVLVAGGKEKKARFIDEISVMNDNSDEIEGILPIIRFSNEEFWYIMPIAKSAISYLIENKTDIKGIVEHVIQLCETLEFLHRKGIAHRDIKPSNIYFYKSRFYFGDFGLVEFPDNLNDFTKSDKDLGAIFTIAPEMKRNPKNADGKKADVFSLAKTLWMFLTNDEKGFDGVYSYFDSHHSLRCFDTYKETHLVELEELLKDATDNSPDIRPNISEFKEKLIDWIEIYSDIDKSQASDWNFLNKQLFGVNSPDSSSWRNVDRIVNVLNIIGKTPAYNHMLFHSGGGLDFSYAEIASEDNCIKLYDDIGFCHIVKPKILHFEGFDRNYKWNYFLLELDDLQPILGGNVVDSEYLIEDYPANYVSSKYAQYGVYDYETGIPLPDGYQTVYRYTRGKFLIVMKQGPYNGISGTYDGRHGDCNASEFRDYIYNLVKLYMKIYDYTKQDDSLRSLSDAEIEDRILHLKEFNKNPFRKRDIGSSDKRKIRKSFSDKKKSKDYISDFFVDWNFSHILEEYKLPESTVIKYVFEFNSPNNYFWLKSRLEMSNYICKDGMIKKIDTCESDLAYCVYDRETAIEIKNRLEKEISEILKENNLEELDDYETCFNIELVRIGNPTHLFTINEIEEEMRKADDRLGNILVIDENGYAKVIKNEGLGYLYPVSHESYDPGNMYVGKYSSLSTLGDNYISSLQGWLSYLKTGRKQYMDYVHKNRNEEKLISNIKEYY